MKVETIANCLNNESTLEVFMMIAKKRAVFYNDIKSQMTHSTMCYFSMNILQDCGLIVKDKSPYTKSTWLPYSLTALGKEMLPIIRQIAVNF